MGSSRPFRFGVINERMQTASAWNADARRAEQLGYSTFLIRDHFVPDHFGDQFAPFSALMAAASVTKTMRVGSLVIDNDYRHPVVLAKEAATLDLLSGGRFELGLGAGFLKTEYDKAGVTFDRPGVRISRLAEALEVLKGLFAEGPLTFRGQHYRIDGLRGYPQPALSVNMGETVTPWEFSVEGESGLESDERIGAGPRWAGDRGGSEGDAAAVHARVQAEDRPGGGRL